MTTTGEFDGELFLTIFLFSLSASALVFKITLRPSSDSCCEKLFDQSEIILFLFLLLVSLVGLIAICNNITWLYGIYAVAMFLMMALLFCFTIFLVVVTFKYYGQVLLGKCYPENQLKDYPHWLQKRVSDANKWNTIKSCLIDARLCSNFSITYPDDMVEELYSKRVSELQSGCCKPSNDCNFTYVSPTVWDKSDDAVYTNPDCSAWDNDPYVLCYGCQSCKAGVLEELQEGRLFAWILVFHTVVIFCWFLAFLGTSKANKINPIIE